MAVAGGHDDESAYRPGQKRGGEAHDVGRILQPDTAAFHTIFLQQFLQAEQRGKGHRHVALRRVAARVGYAELAEKIAQEGR